MNKHIPRKPRLDPLVYSVPQIAALLDINLPKAYELAKSEGFPAVTIGKKRIIVPKAAFERWLEQAAFEKQSCCAAENQ